MKIIGMGLNKTGTKTLGECFRILGFSYHMTCNEVAFNLWRKGDTDELMKIASVYNTFEDWPWPLLYREFDKYFPGSKFILTVRKNPETWYRSLCNHSVRTGPTEYRKAIYGEYMPHENKDSHINFYESYNQAIRDYFRERSQDFLEVCWEAGDDWDQLCHFLGLPLPNSLFPHANKGAYDI
jgi:hypothetical protein